ncbi:MAG: hypothetical protein GXO23_06095 [Crenarchaeota archaeon]|nr:hypothetical protein [Thermoproteota archaeon]
MIFKLGKYKRYRKIIGRRLYTPDGRDLGRIVSIKVGKKTGQIKAMLVDCPDGVRRELRVHRIIEISDGRVIAEVELPQELVKKEEKVQKKDVQNIDIVDLESIEASIEEFRRKINDIREKYGKLLELLISKEIDLSIYTEVKERLDKEREELKMKCERKIKEIEDKIREIDYRTEDLRRKRSQLYVKKVLGGITPEEERELQIIDEMYKSVEERKKRLYMMRQELVSLCSQV